MPTAWRIAIPARGLAIETTPLNAEKLDGHQLSLLGRPDQLCRQPRRRRLSGIDGVLRPHRHSNGDFPMFHLHRARHLPCRPVLLLHLDAGRAGARQVRRQAAGDLGPSRFRARLSGADEHAGMDADLPAVAVAVCDLSRRSLRGHARLVWIIGRILYLTGYSKAVEKRSPGFAIQALVCIVLWLGAFGAAAWSLDSSLTIAPCTCEIRIPKMRCRPCLAPVMLGGDMLQQQRTSDVRCCCFDLPRPLTPADGVFVWGRHFCYKSAPVFEIFLSAPGRGLARITMVLQ